MKLCAWFFATLAGASIASANVMWIESALGEFSDDFSNPTEVVLVPGITTLEFTIGGPPVSGGAPNGNGGATNGSDADFFELLIPPGTEVTSIFVETSTGGPHFFAAEFGSGFSAQPVDDPASVFATSLDGYFVFGPNTDLAPFIGDPRFPLDISTDISLLFQETGGTFGDVRVNVTTTPEPTRAILLAMGLVVLLVRRRRCVARGLI